MPLSAAIFAAEGAGGIAVGAAAARPARRRWRGRRLWPRGGGAAPAASGDCAQQRADRDRIAGLGDDFGEHARGRRVDFERDLVGLEFDQRFVRLHGVAALLEPFADGRLGDRLAEGGNANFSGHLHIAPEAAPFC